MQLPLSAEYRLTVYKQWIGSLLSWRLLDPIGGMILSAYIIIEWIKTLLENFANCGFPVLSLRLCQIDWRYILDELI